MTDELRRFAEAAVRKKKLFLVLSGVGVLVGLGLASYYLYLWGYDRLPEADRSGRFTSGAVIVVLVLLNARQNLRQHKYAKVLEEILPG